MLMRNHFAQIILLFFVGIAMTDLEAQGQSLKFHLTKFDNYGCQSKGRSQDCSGRLMQEILVGGKGSIPILISQLTDTAR